VKGDAPFEPPGAVVSYARLSRLHLTQRQHRRRAAAPPKGESGRFLPSTRVHSLVMPRPSTAATGAIRPRYTERSRPGTTAIRRSLKPASRRSPPFQVPHPPPLRPPHARFHPQAARILAPQPQSPPRKRRRAPEGLTLGCTPVRALCAQTGGSALCLGAFRAGLPMRRSRRTIRRRAASAPACEFRRRSLHRGQRVQCRPQRTEKICSLPPGGVTQTWSAMR